MTLPQRSELKVGNKDNAFADITGITIRTGNLCTDPSSFLKEIPMRDSEIDITVKTLKASDD
jgi:hypothetical protein